MEKTTEGLRRNDHRRYRFLEGGAAVAFGYAGGRLEEFTFRAHEEREFFKIPQESATMGILVNRSFGEEAANGVAFTGDPTNPRGGC